MKTTILTALAILASAALGAGAGVAAQHLASADPGQPGFGVSQSTAPSAGPTRFHGDALLAFMPAAEEVGGPLGLAGPLSERDMELDPSCGPTVVCPAPGDPCANLDFNGPAVPVDPVYALTRTFTAPDSSQASLLVMALEYPSAAMSAGVYDEISGWMSACGASSGPNTTTTLDESQVRAMTATGTRGWILVQRENVVVWAFLRSPNAGAVQIGGELVRHAAAAAPNAA